jgi:hypothetical protein
MIVHWTEKEERGDCPREGGAVNPGEHAHARTHGEHMGEGEIWREILAKQGRQ